MIQIKNLTKKYKDTIVLENMSYDFPAYGLVCLLGASGSGKTTLLNLLAGFDTQYEGEIFVGGTQLHTMNADTLCSYRKDTIGFVFQNYHLLHGYTVLENIVLVEDLTNEDKGKAESRARELLKQVGILEKEKEKVENLSGGQKQRVAIARALMKEPQIIFADEPTGALDRKTSLEIMELLKQIAKKHLVIVITHDSKISEFADEVIYIKERKIVSSIQNERNRNSEHVVTLTKKEEGKKKVFQRAHKNFKVYLKGYFVVSFAISIGILALLYSFSFQNVIDYEIIKFKTKNTAFQNGYIKGSDNGSILEYLKNEPKIEDVYYQYKLKDILLTLDGMSKKILEKIPMPKATEGMSYGTMPLYGKNEIAITPSLARTFSNNIQTLIGTEITLQLGERSYRLTISGIYNAGYDDFFVSSDIEKQLYQEMDKTENYSISYDVKTFHDVIAVSNQLKLRGINPETAEKEVYALEHTFKSLKKLFVIISLLVLGMVVFVCSVILIKQQNARVGEFGLLSALGFHKKRIASIIFQENLFLMGLTSVCFLCLLLMTTIIGIWIGFPISITGMQVIFCVVGTAIVVMLLSSVASYKLLHIEPAIALKKA